VAVQLVLGIPKPFVVFEPGFDAYERANLFEAYGPGLLGEVSPLSVGAFFFLQFSFAFTSFAFANQRRHAFWWLALSTCFLFALLLALSRVMLVGAVLSVAVAGVAAHRIRRSLL